jgi:hypothetical protein
MLERVGFSDMQVHRRAHWQKAVLGEFLPYAVQHFHTFQLMVIDDNFSTSQLVIRLSLGGRGVVEKLESPPPHHPAPLHPAVPTIQLFSFSTFQTPLHRRGL